MRTGAGWRRGLGVYGLVEVLAVVRWQLLLRIQGFRLGWARATGILFIGEFFLTFTPGLVGGDAMRIFYLVKDAPEKKGRRRDRRADGPDHGDAGADLPGGDARQHAPRLARCNRRLPRVWSRR